MEQFFNVLTASVRLDKSQKRRKSIISQPESSSLSLSLENQKRRLEDELDASVKTHRDGHNKKRKITAEKEKQIHTESVQAFRNKMGIRLSAECRHDSSIPDPISSFDQIAQPDWWQTLQTTNGSNGKESVYQNIHTTITRNIERGQWINPTPIQMQAVPALLARRDLLGCAPTGSGKSGAFLIPTLILSSCPEDIFYKRERQNQCTLNKKMSTTGQSSSEQQQKHKIGGGIRALILAPSRELAQQLYREATRLGEGKVGGVHVLLLSKSNLGSLLASTGDSNHTRGYDILISTPLRLVECIEGTHMNSSHQRKLDLSRVRIIVLDEADRLLDCNDGNVDTAQNTTIDEGKRVTSGSSHSRSFLSQVDSILSAIPPTASRALFSATIGPTVRQLSESILRNPIDISILHVTMKGTDKDTPTTGGVAVASSSSSAALGVNSNVHQSLQFVGNEEGKLLAIRQLIQKGFHPPALVFLQSQERAQALYEELLYDRIRVDVLHAGRSQAARDKAVNLFRSGETWILICTDLCARGIDFKAANLVINYDMPEDGICYVHRIGRTGRGGRSGEAITFFTEADFPNLRKIANIVKLSGSKDVPDWMLNLNVKRPNKTKMALRREAIYTKPKYDTKIENKKKMYIANSFQKKNESIIDKEED